MAVDTPARIAILGAGPIGLEAGLYGRYLGYEVDVYERGRVCENLLRWGHVGLFSPSEMNRSRLGLAALTAQYPQFSPPSDNALETGRELAENYFLPLAESDLLADSIRTNTEILVVGRDGPLKGDLVGDPQRAEADFRLLVRDARGCEHVKTAEIVIDTTGTYGNHNRLAPGGIPAVGEIDAEAHIEYGLPDVLGAARDRYAGRHTMVVGAGYSAATSIVSLCQLAEEVPDTRITWLTRKSETAGGPVRRIPNDQLPQRDRLARRANALAAEQRVVRHLPATTILAIEPHQGGLRLEMTGEHNEPLEVEAVIANVGYRPDRRLYEELQVHECYASGGPMKLAAALLARPTVDCLEQTSGGPETLITPEPNFYILGSKSYGRGSQFLLSIGRQQIRDLFTIIGDRADLDLYATMSSLS